MNKIFILIIISIAATLTLATIALSKDVRQLDTATVSSASSCRILSPMAETEPKEEITTETAAKFEPPLACVTPIISSHDPMKDVPLDTNAQIEIEQLCVDRDINIAVVLSIIEHESQFDANVVGDRGNSFGLMQIQPRWHSERMEQLGVTDLFDPVQNVTVGIDYLDELLNLYGGDYEKALTAYNAGHYRGTISAYAIKVMEGAKKYEA